MKSNHRLEAEASQQQEWLALGVNKLKYLGALAAATVVGAAGLASPSPARAEQQASSGNAAASVAEHKAGDRGSIKERRKFLDQIYTSKKPNVLLGGLRVDVLDDKSMIFRYHFDKNGNGTSATNSESAGHTAIFSFPHYTEIGRLNHPYLVFRETNLLGTNIDPSYLGTTPEDASATFFLDLIELRKLSLQGKVKLRWLSMMGVPPRMERSTIVDGRVRLADNPGLVDSYLGSYKGGIPTTGGITPDDVMAYTDTIGLRDAQPNEVPSFWKKLGKSK